VSDEISLRVGAEPLKRIERSFLTLIAPGKFSAAAATPKSVDAFATAL